MKFNCGITYEEKCRARKEWHKHFAWIPIHFGSRDCRWLETVERRNKHYYVIDWEYREVK